MDEKRIERPDCKGGGVCREERRVGVYVVLPKGGGQGGTIALGTGIPVILSTRDRCKPEHGEERP